MFARLSVAFFAALILLSGCATQSTIASRKLEKPQVYESLTKEQKALVDAGQIRVGMTEDAVYLAWGKPDQITKSENASGLITTWIYMGSWMEESRYWAYSEHGRDHGSYIDRYVQSDYTPRTYVSAELNFEKGVLKNWRTLPQPGS